MSRARASLFRLLCAIASCAALSACTQDSESGRSPASSSCSLVELPGVLDGVTGATETAHDSSVAVAKTVLAGTGPLNGLADAVPSSREIVFTFTVPDLGANGSITLVAETTSFPSQLSGNAYPFLVSLNDGTNELVNLTRAGTGSDCAAAGYFTCSGTSCSSNPNCVITNTNPSPSSFTERRHWQQYQLPPDGFVSTNTFPTCNWTSGSPTCRFNSTFFSGGKLRPGTYTARYALLASNYKNTTFGLQASMKLSVIQKSDAAFGSPNGAVDLNVVLVGKKNVQDVDTPKGKTNLNALFQHVQNHYSQPATGISLGKIRLYKLGGCDDGSAWANVSIDLTGYMFDELSRLMPADAEGKALNIFIVSSIPYDSSNLTILGLAGAINGPPVNGTMASGLVFSSFDSLATYNPSCGATSCPITDQEDAFRDMGATISHEMGHYLGLNHLSESSGTQHDFLADTPTCPAGSGGSVTHTSCLGVNACGNACPGYNGSTVFCTAAPECEFNHIMWYTSKYYGSAGSGDGNLFTANSSRIVNYNSFVR